MHQGASAFAGPDPREPNPHRWWALVGICGAAGLVWLAFAEVGVALPTIGDSVIAPLTQLQWINNAFGLTCGALVLAAGWLCDRWRERMVLIIGIVVFGVAALATSMFSGLLELTAGRALMGIGAALILPATLAMIPTLFPDEEQLHAFAVWSVVAWVAQATAPALSGAVIELLGWRALFWLKLPLAAAAIAIILVTCPAAVKWPPTHKLDVAGLLASAAAAFFALSGFTLGAERGFGHPLTIGGLLAAAVCLLLFIVVERRAEHPIVDRALLRLRDVDSALIANLTMVFVFTGCVLLTTIYLQDVRGYSPLEAGLLVAPSTLTILAFTPVGARLSRRSSARTPIIAGLVVLGVGLFLVGRLTPASAYYALAAGLLVVGAGCGLLSGPLTHTTVAGPPPHLAGTASGLFKMSSMLGGSLGVAILIAIAQPGGDPAIETKRIDEAIQIAGLLTLTVAALVWVLWPRHARTDAVVREAVRT